MVIFWKGAGIAVPILFFIAAGIVSFFVEDTRIGNATFMGWSLVLAGVFNILPALAAFAGPEEGEEEDREQTGHAFFFLPIWMWVMGCLALGVFLLVG